MKTSKIVSLTLVMAFAAAAQHAGAAAAKGADLKTGEKIYGATCVACHASGVLNAPKFGDKAAWTPRIAKGQAVLYASAIKGFNMMPAKGGNASLSDADLKSAVDYMVSKAK
jgi:cytochrome c5